jgi:hypothetical protein
MFVSQNGLDYIATGPVGTFHNDSPFPTQFRPTEDTAGFAPVANANAPELIWSIGSVIVYTTGEIRIFGGPIGKTFTSGDYGTGFNVFEMSWQL